MAPGGNVINNQLRNSFNISPNMPGYYTPYQTVGAHAAVPPPLPPRQPIQNYFGHSDSRPYGLSYGNFGYGGNYNGYRSYNGYGSFGNYMPYSNSYGQIGGHSGDVETRFQQYAEESTRSTFRVVETVLHTFSSITMLLESTYIALTSSFRAILSVADNIGRLRSTIGQLLSTFALIRAMKWIYKKILLMLGLGKQNTLAENLWQQSISEVTNVTSMTNGTANGQVSLWINILLFGVFVVIPYLIHKISKNVRQTQLKVNDPKEWVKCEDPVCVANAMYDFTAVSNEELSFKAGQKIWLAPQSLQSKNAPGWLIATDNRNVGLIPANYVNIVGQLKKKPESENNKDDIEPNFIQNKTSNEETTFTNMQEPNTSSQSTDFSTNNINNLF